MSSAASQRLSDADSGFPLLLRTWRQKRRLSQLELALSSGVSQRHVSFLESGRANPSRNMILQLSETLGVPLRERNDWLTAAGFAPVFKARPLDDPQMSQVMGAIQMMLSNHEPFPAVAIDRAWNIRMANASFERMGEMLGANLWQRVGGAQRNLMRLFFHPNGIKPFVTNWTSIAPLLWHRAQREAESLGGQEMKQVLLGLCEYQDADTLWAAADAAGSGPAARNRKRRHADFAVHGDRDIRHRAGCHRRRVAHRESVPGGRGDGGVVSGHDCALTGTARILVRLCRCNTLAAGQEASRSQRGPGQYL